MIIGNPTVFPIFPTFYVTKTGGNQSIPNTGPVKVTWDTEDDDPYNYFDMGNERWTPLVSGYYLISLHLTWNAGAANEHFYTEIYLNGVQLCNQRIGMANSGNQAGATVVTVIFLNGSTDYIEAFVEQYNAGNRLVLSGYMQAYMSGSRIA